MLTISLTRHPHARKELFWDRTLRVVSRSGLNPTEAALLALLPTLPPANQPLFLGGRTGALALTARLRGWGGGGLTVHTFDAHTEAAAKTRFCTIVVSNANRDGACVRLFDLLSAHKPVASGGKWRNSFGGRRVEDKLAFLRTGKFTLACENSAVPDYVTEKIVHAFAAHTVPIYWGAPNVSEDFNPAAFVDCSRFPSLEAVAEEVRRLDADDAAYEAMLAAPIFREGRCPHAFEEGRLREFFGHILAQMEAGTARRRSRQACAERVWERDRVASRIVSKRGGAVRHALKLLLSGRYRSFCRRLGD